MIRPRREILHQLEDIFRKSAWVGAERSTQRMRSCGIGSRCGAEPEVNPAREQRLQRAELLGDPFADADFTAGEARRFGFLADVELR